MYSRVFSGRLHRISGARREGARRIEYPEKSTRRNRGRGGSVKAIDHEFVGAKCEAFVVVDSWVCAKQRNLNTSAGNLRTATFREGDDGEEGLTRNSWRYQLDKCQFALRLGDCVVN